MTDGNHFDLQLHNGAHVSVPNEIIVDSDANEFELARRLELRQRLDLINPAAIIKAPKSLDERAEMREEHLDSPESDFPDFASPAE